MLRFIVLSLAISIGIFQIAVAQNDKGHGEDKATGGPVTNHGPKLRVVVSDLESKVQNVVTTVSTPSGTTSVVSLDLQQPTEFGSGLTEMLITALSDSKRYVVLDRKMLEDFAREKALAGTDQSTVAAAGKLLGAQVIMKGAVTEISFKRSGAGANLVSQVIDGSIVNSVATVAIDLRIIDIESGEIIESVRAVGRVGTKLMSLTLNAEDIKLGLASFDNGPIGFAVRSAINEAVRKFGERTAKIPWEAKVAAIVDEDDVTSLYLNVGDDSGLKVGDVLQVAHPGKPIIDPDTGRMIGKTKGKVVGHCKVQSVEGKITIALPTDGSGFQREDTVQMMVKPKEK